MKRNTTRFLCLLLCLLTAAAVILTGCGGGEESSSPATSGTGSDGETSGTPTSIYQDADGKYTLDNLGMPAFDFQEEEFVVCVYNNNVQTTYFSEEIDCSQYETSDSVLKDAVTARNDLIEEKYGVKVVALAVDSVPAAMRDASTTGLTPFDAAMPFMGDAVSLARDGMMYNLKEFSDYIHFDAPWWDHSACETLSVDNKLFFTTGDISIMQKIVSGAILFNKNLYGQYLEEQYGSLYDKVKQNKWTFDLLYEMTAPLTHNLDDNPAINADDFFGLSAGNGDAISFYLAGGENLVLKDAEDMPIVHIGTTENSVNLAQKIITRIIEPDYALISEDYRGQVSNCWEYCLGVFGQNRSVFRTTAFSAIKKLRNYEGADPFGIVPYPMATEGQEEYCTPCSAIYAYGICIPYGVKNPDFSAYMIEALSCYAKNLITPAYYETTLKSRDLSYDDESGEMLDDYIFSHVVYDIGVIYNFGGIKTMFDNLMNGKNANVTSTLEGILPGVETAIAECVEAYRANAD